MLEQKSQRYHILIFLLGVLILLQVNNALGIFFDKLLKIFVTITFRFVCIMRVLSM